MKLRIKELCEERGIKSAYSLAKLSKLKMPTAYRAFSNDVKHFTLETLEALCDALQCTPNDIFGAELVKVKAEKPVREPGAVKVERIVEPLDGEYTLTTKEVSRQLDLQPRTVREKAEKGELPGRQGKQSHWFFRQSDVDDYVVTRFAA